MEGGNLESSEHVAQVVKRCLEEGRTVEIDGLGLFRPNPSGGFEFVAPSAPQVFVAYVVEDAGIAGRLYDDLARGGLAPWIDRRKLLPGQNWPRSIEEAIETSDFVLACFSRNSVRKKGGFQAEIRYALDCARRLPLDETFLIPVRLDNCSMPARIQREIQYIDLFPDWGRGLRQIRTTVARQMRRRGRG